MPLRRLFLLALAICATAAAVVGASAQTASAHNTLLSSDPADGTALTAAPTQITWNFDNSVPLDTMTVTLIDATGARTELSGSAHGPAGDTQVITPLPALPSGPVSLRWRLVGPDGHPITGRVDVTITATPASAAPPTTSPAPASATPTTTAPPIAIAEVARNEDDGVFSTPSLARWLMRYGSYLAIMAVVGILLTSATVWPAAGSHPVLRSILSRALIATAILGLAQLLVVASDIGGMAPWSSFDAVDAATTTHAGMAFLVRIALALTMWIVLFRYRIAHADLYWTAISIPGIGLLATWAFAGHSRSMRWPVVGVATDVAHHAAAAVWIGGLAIVGWMVIPRTKPDVMVAAVRNFARVAAVSVTVLVVTGIVQSLRLVGSPTELLDANHGRYLAVKVAVLGAMLVLANANRRRVDTRLDDDTHVDLHIGAIRQGVVAEFAIGLVIVGITAAMVVSPPATSEAESGAPRQAASPALYYTM